MATTKTPRWTHDESAKGHYPSAEYRAWHLMKARVNNRRKGYEHVTYTPRWEKYENFLADMGRKPSPRHSLDRKNGQLGYTKANCRWATPLEQARNTRVNRLMSFRGRTQCAAAWAAEMGVSAPCLFWRLANGWSIRAALTNPSQRIA